jgi:hypothetical protein
MVDETQNKAEETAENKEATETTTIPQERLDAEIDKRKAAEDQTRTLQAQMQLLQANQQQAQQQERPKPEDIFDGVFEDDDTVPDVNQLKQLFGRIDKKFSSAIAGMSVVLQHPDYNEVVNSEAFKQLLKDDPTLGPEIMASGDPLRTTYRIAKLAVQTAKKNEPSAEAKAAAEKALANAEKPGSASEASGAGGIEKAKTISNMSPDQFAKYRETVKRRAAV